MMDFDDPEDFEAALTTLQSLAVVAGVLALCGGAFGIVVWLAN